MQEMRDSNREEATEASIGFKDYHPCYYFEVLAKAVLKCLGLESCLTDQAETTSDSNSDGDPPSTNEQEPLINTDSVARRGRRAPPKPGVSSGKAPGTN